MKKTIKISYLLVLITFMAIHLLDAQIPSELYSECGTCESCATISFEPSGIGPCDGNSPYYLYSNYHLPDQNADDLHIRVNLIFLSKADGSGMFDENNQEHNDIIDEICDDINFRYGNLINPSGNDCYIESGFLSNSKIQFEFNKVYISDEFAWNNENDDWTIVGGVAHLCPDNDWYINPLDNQIINDPLIPRGINIYFTETKWYYDSLVVDQTTENQGPLNHMCSEYPSMDLDASLRIHAMNVFTKYYWMKNVYSENHEEEWDPTVRSWFIGTTGSLIAHEITHNFVLSHVTDCNYRITFPGWPNNRRSLEPTGEIDKVHHVLALANIRRFVTDDSFNSVPEQIQEDITIDANIKFYQDIIIEPGYTLTVTCKLVMVNNAKIIVKPGAKLLIDGGTITSENGKFWQGIEVWGNSNQSQSPLNQGFLEIKNNGTVENAITAVLLNDNYSGNNQTGDKTGGIIHATNANFVNNQSDIIFGAYNQTTNSLFINCSFKTDENWLGQGRFPEAHISMFDYQGLMFSGCTFINESPELFPVDQRGVGLLSSNSTYTVDNWCVSGSPCSLYQPSEFDDLYYGIYALGTTSERTILVRNSVFNTYRGIYNSGVDNSTFVLNDFTVPNNIPGTAESYGLYLDNCTGFQVEGNYFEGIGQGTNVGLYVNNSGTDDNLIYNNTFKDFHTASAYQDINRNYLTGGLEIKCNDYIGNTNDVAIVIEDAYQGPNHGIAQAQGYIPGFPNQSDPTAPAGNTFSNFTGHSWDIYNESNSIVYIYHNYLNALPKKVRPNLNYGSVSPYENQFSIYSKELACPSTFSGSGDGGALMSMMIAAESSADSTSTELTALIDGGDSDELTFDVAMAMPGEEIETRDILLAESPDLSDTVMVAAVEKEEVLPNAMVRDILVENPQAAKSAKVQNALDNRDDEMPQYMRNQINQGMDTLSQKELLESNLAYQSMKKAWAFNQLHLLYRTDSAIVNVKDSLAQLYALSGGIANSYRLAMLHLASQDTSQAFTTLAAIQNDFELTSQQQDEYEAYEDYFKLVRRLQRENLVLLDSTAITTLQQIEQQESGKPSIYARNLLIGAGEMIYTETVLLPDTSLKASSYVDPTLIKIEQEESNHYIKLKPNPANDYFIVEWKITESVEDCWIYVVDIDGRFVDKIKVAGSQNEKVISTVNWKPGTYIINLTSKGVILDTAKLSVLN